MPKAKSKALLSLLESDEEEQDTLTSTMAPAKRGRPAAAAKATNTAQNATRQTSVAAQNNTDNSKQKPMQGRGRKRQAPEDAEIEDEPSQNEDSIEGNVKPKGARGRPRGAKAARLSDVTDQPAVDSEAEPASQPARRGRKPKAQTATPPMDLEIPETQPPQPEIPETQPIETFDDSLDQDEVEDLPIPAYSRSVMSAQRPQHHMVPFSANRRPMAASDSELHDPMLRRRLGDLTRKYDSLEAKYRDLRELGIKEAERNYDKLKKQGEERAATADQLITTLKAQLATQTELAKEGQRMKQQLESSEDKVAAAQTKLGETTKSLTEAQAEIKTLKTKLAAARSAEAAQVKVPSSAIKNNSAPGRLLANAEAAAQVAQLKEDLYADMTGLIITSVKREEDGEVYDCIQTGRNGTLHFKLSVGPDEESENIDDAEFIYMPQLDESRDRDLIEVLPNFLVEEISFPRPHAAKFYSRVMKSLTERLD
ncbi:chromosome segregation protein [Apiospora aurea]|uniref:Chromosome segregation protein n=1 Tax=Apiospora aurea TaxID=335848 RepID=A0ABR1QJD5_9PEZI